MMRVVAFRTHVCVGTMAQDRDRFRCFDMCDMIIPFPVVPRDNAVGRAAKARLPKFTVQKRA